ncbi:psbP chloroplastic [Micractinium conductrix]|uniref:PsbP chloroplastic n=1 Tax=Micractinium conductrix TaxID=554055 RepID=A0A2P6V8J0_9CHLO|nr:psbP chloroplastic [Micractinium conductrix]|eukprot:PSC70397.1 psbP chloroplastic [Micractinium conductrix]
MAAQTTASCAFVAAAAPARPRAAAARAAPGVVCSAQRGEAAPTRRQALQLATGLAVVPLLAGSAQAAKGPKGFVPLRDSQDGYSFLYPFGWQEVSVDGQDVVYKDVIEPLESVSVSLVATEKTDVTEFGDAKEVAFTLADKVLTAPNQEVKLVGVNERTNDGRKYIDFEFTAKNSVYTRHALASVTVGNGKFYTLVTGSNERRWNRMQDKVKIVVQSFTVDDRFDL